MERLSRLAVYAASWTLQTIDCRDRAYFKVRERLFWKQLATQATKEAQSIKTALTLIERLIQKQVALLSFYSLVGSFDSSYEMLGSGSQRGIGVLLRSSPGGIARKITVCRSQTSDQLAKTFSVMVPFIFTEQQVTGGR